MIDLYEAGFKKFPWWMDWRGQCVAIIAGGPSAGTVGVEKLRDRIHCVVINESYRLCPWADILYSCDSLWWKLRKKEVKSFGGLKITNEFNSYIADMGLSRITVALDHTKRNFLNEFAFEEPGVIGGGLNSGFQTINLVAQLGATGIMLVGYDMNLMGGVHWHGKHPEPLRNPDYHRFEEWPVVMDRAAPKLKVSGIDVVNTCMTSSLRAFEKVSLEEALRRWSL